MRHISFNVDPGVKYLIGGPTISARASVNERNSMRENKTNKIKINNFITPNPIYFSYPSWYIRRCFWFYRIILLLTAVRLLYKKSTPSMGEVRASMLRRMSTVGLANLHFLNPDTHPYIHTYITYIPTLRNKVLFTFRESRVFFVV